MSNSLLEMAAFYTRGGLTLALGQDICIDNRSSIAGPVHLHNRTGFVVQVHGGVDLCQIVGIVLVELG